MIVTQFNQWKCQKQLEKNNNSHLSLISLSNSCCISPAKRPLTSNSFIRARYHFPFSPVFLTCQPHEHCRVDFFFFLSITLSRKHTHNAPSMLTNTSTARWGSLLHGAKTLPAARINKLFHNEGAYTERKQPRHVCVKTFHFRTGFGWRNELMFGLTYRQRQASLFVPPQRGVVVVRQLAQGILGNVMWAPSQLA